MVVKLKNKNDFKLLLLVKGFTQRSLAREIGISEPYSNQISNGTRNPGPGIAKKIYTALGVTFDDIFFVENDCKSYQTAATE